MNPIDPIAYIPPNPWTIAHADWIHGAHSDALEGHPSPFQAINPALDADHIPMPHHVATQLDAFEGQNYLESILNYILYRARSYFNQSQNYMEADKLYDMYFQYRNYYAPQFPELFDAYRTVMFESFWVKDILDKRAEVDRLLNQELVRDLQTTIKATISKTDDFREKITHMQHTGELPTTLHLERPASERAVHDMAHALAEGGFAPQAKVLLAHLELRQAVDLMRTEREIQELNGQAQRQSVQFPMAGKGPGHWGLPMAPYLPLPTGTRMDAGHPPAFAYYYTDKVTPVFSLNKDPNEGEERRRREQRSGQRRRILKNPFNAANPTDCPAPFDPEEQ